MPEVSYLRFTSMPTLTVKDATLFYEDAGAGRPLILLHGVWENSRLFRHQIAHFAATQRVIAPDMRGHGRSERTRDGYSVAQFARDLRGLIERLALDDIVLVGHSMGAFVLWDYIRQFGTQGVRGAVVIDQPASDFKWPDFPFGIADFTELCAWMAAIQSDRDGFVRATLPLLFKNELDAATAEFLFAQQTILPPCEAAAILFDQTVQDYRDLLPKVDVPCLLCFGRDEKIVPLAGSQHLLQHLPDARLVIFENSGHFPHWEEPERFNAELAKFLAEL